MPYKFLKLATNGENRSNSYYEQKIVSRLDVEG